MHKDNKIANTRCNEKTSSLNIFAPSHSDNFPNKKPQMITIRDSGHDSSVTAQPRAICDIITNEKWKIIFKLKKGEIFKQRPRRTKKERVALSNVEVSITAERSLNTT